MTEKYAPSLLAEVAEICADVHGIRPHNLTLQERLGVSKNTARNMIYAARKAGHRIEDDRGSRCLPDRSVLACSCGEQFEVESVRPVDRLLRHTRTAHGRVPSMLERTPKQVAA